MKYEILPSLLKHAQAVLDKHNIPEADPLQATAEFPQVCILNIYFALSI